MLAAPRRSTANVNPTGVRANLPHSISKVLIEHRNGLCSRQPGTIGRRTSPRQPGNFWTLAAAMLRRRLSLLRSRKLFGLVRRTRASSTSTGRMMRSLVVLRCTLRTLALSSFPRKPQQTTLPAEQATDLILEPSLLHSTHHFRDSRLLEQPLDPLTLLSTRKRTGITDQPTTRNLQLFR